MRRVWTLILLLTLCVQAEEQPAAPAPETPKDAPEKKPGAASDAQPPKNVARKNAAPKKKKRYLLRYELAPGKRFIGSNTVTFELKHKVRSGNKTEESRESVERTERFRDHIKASSTRGPLEIERQYQRLFTKVRTSARGRPDVDQNPLQGRTVTITERRRRRSVRAGKAVKIPSFVRKTIGIEIDWRDVLPREPVAVGDAWEADAEAFARRLAPYLDSGSRARMIIRFESIVVRDGARCANFYIDLRIDGMRDLRLFTKAQMAGDALFDMDLKRFILIDLSGSFVVRGAIVGEGAPRIIQSEGKASYKSTLREVKVAAAAPTEKPKKPKKN